VAWFVEEENHWMIPILVQETLLMFVVGMFVVVDQLLSIVLRDFVMVVEDKNQYVVLLMMRMEHDYEKFLRFYLKKKMMKRRKI